MPSRKVISVGADPELLWLRNFVLTSAGFDIATTPSHQDALTAIQQGECGTLLMCYSLPKTTRQLLAAAFRKYCPDGHIIAITNQQMEKPDFADTFVYGVEGPEALIEAIRCSSDQ
jgi:DNA-binding NtrC family response regulator